MVKEKPKSERARSDNRSLDAILERNIQALMERRRDEESSISKHQGAALAIVNFIGSFGFVYSHLALFGVWTFANTIGVPGIPRFDPELVFMATFAAVEAIFLTTLVLINQNRMSAAADKRAELDLQVNLLTEHELTRLIHLMSAVAERLNVRSGVEEELEELKQDVQVDEVLDKIENAEEAKAEAATDENHPRR